MADESPRPEEEVADAAAASEEAPDPVEPAPPAAPAEPETDWHDKYVRSVAELDNVRKRLTKQARDAEVRGVGRLAKELLPALDHFELALRSVQADEETRKGFTLVRDELLKALGRVGVQPFSPQGEPFDPAEHEAMAQQAVEGAETGSVVEVYQQGYRLNGAVLRPARVVVAA